MGFRQISSYMPEQFRQISSYLPEQFRQISSNLPEQFRQISSYLPEQFRQITSSFFYFAYSLHDELLNCQCHFSSLSFAHALWPLVSCIHFSSCQLFSHSNRVVSTELEFMLRIILSVIFAKNLFCVIHHNSPKYHISTA